MLDSHFTKATQKATQHSPASDGFETRRVTENEVTPRFRRVTSVQVSDEGREPYDSETAVTIRNPIGLRQTEQTANWQSGAHSGARSDADAILADADLAVIVEAWPMLSADAQRAMVEFVRREVGTVLPLQIE